MGFATSQLCTDEDGTSTNNLVLYYGTECYIEKGGERSAGYGLKGNFNPPQASYWSSIVLLSQYKVLV
jgi:hypothetical protein